MAMPEVRPDLVSGLGAKLHQISASLGRGRGTARDCAGMQAQMSARMLRENKQLGASSGVWA